VKVVVLLPGQAAIHRFAGLGTRIGHNEADRLNQVAFGDGSCGVLEIGELGAIGRRNLQLSFWRKQHSGFGLELFEIRESEHRRRAAPRYRPLPFTGQSASDGTLQAAAVWLVSGGIRCGPGTRAASFTTPIASGKRARAFADLIMATRLICDDGCPVFVTGGLRADRHLRAGCYASRRSVQRCVRRLRREGPMGGRIEGPGQSGHRSPRGRIH